MEHLLDARLEARQFPDEVSRHGAVDAALLKSVQVKEGQRFEFRLEATNFTNTPIFSDPATAFGSSNFGTITGTKIGSRNVQLGFKYYF